MSGVSGALISSFNTFVDNQKRERGSADISLVTFASYNEFVFAKRDVKSLSEITKHEYNCGGLTAMYDAIGAAIDKYKNDEDVIMIVQSDGYENDSKRYNSSNIKQMVRERINAGWQFVFMGADIDVDEVSNTIGFPRAIEFDKSSGGLETAFSTMSSVASNFRASLDDKILKPNSYGGA